MRIYGGAGRKRRRPPPAHRLHPNDLGRPLLLFKLNTSEPYYIPPKWPTTPWKYRSSFNPPASIRTLTQLMTSTQARQLQRNNPSWKTQTRIQTALPPTLSTKVDSFGLFIGGRTFLLSQICALNRATWRASRMLRHGVEWRGSLRGTRYAPSQLS
jgi:hypothetical protein